MGGMPMRRLDSRLIYGGEDSGTFSDIDQFFFFVKIGRTANCPEHMYCTVSYFSTVQYSTLTQL